ncbi:TIGR02281 family clan AA aspartic protease [Glaciecola sp. SC05]|uniref:retropepsin-like aspartic protease family protein n=1 Tax=Glaciecola sp. SC05 TaxID=1987355 RepID=UPI00352948B0
MKSALSWLLILSLSINAYLWWQLTHTHEQQDTPQNDATSQPSQNLSTSTPLSFADKQSENVVSERASNVDNGRVTDAPPEGVTLAFLRSLKKAKAFEALSFHVRTYLRDNPQDIDALLLEAEAYYYTQPLNTALVNYYGLRDAFILPAQLEEINQLIDVNTTRIIQQFSGDGSWDLLASFLEPLVQVDPLNRRYIMALAKAYGMQAQTVLMENVLAALPANDARAQRLRESIYAQDAEPEPPTLASNQSNNDGFNRFRNGEVRLTERNGQYYTQVMLTNIDAELLVDTGASTTAVSRQVFDLIANDDTAYLGTFNVQTAGGMVSSPIYKVSEITVGQEKLNNVSIMVLPTENMRNFDGLLGMNVIKQFNVAYDQSIGRMRMYKR